MLQPSVSGGWEEIEKLALLALPGHIAVAHTRSALSIELAVGVCAAAERGRWRWRAWGRRPLDEPRVHQLLVPWLPLPIGAGIAMAAVIAGPRWREVAAVVGPGSGSSELGRGRLAVSGHRHGPDEKHAVRRIACRAGHRAGDVIFVRREFGLSVGHSRQQQGRQHRRRGARRVGPWRRSTIMTLRDMDFARQKSVYGCKL